MVFSLELDSKIMNDVMENAKKILFLTGQEQQDA